MKRLLLLLPWFCLNAHADCAAYLTRHELLKVDSRVAREIRRMSGEDLYVRLNWYDAIPRHETRFAMDITRLLHEDGKTPATHPAIPLIPPPEEGHPRLLRSMVRTPGRIDPAIVTARLAVIDGEYHMRVNVRTSVREGEVDHARAEEAIAVYTLLAAAPYVAHLSFRMDFNALEHEDSFITLQQRLRKNVPAKDAVLPIMDVATDILLAKPRFVSQSNLYLRGFRDSEEVELDIAHDFRVLYELRLDDEIVEPLTSAGHRIN